MLPCRGVSEAGSWYDSHLQMGEVVNKWSCELQPLIACQGEDCKASSWQGNNPGQTGLAVQTVITKSAKVSGNAAASWSSSQQGCQEPAAPAMCIFDASRSSHSNYSEPALWAMLPISTTVPGTCSH